MRSAAISVALLLLVGISAAYAARPEPEDLEETVRVVPEGYIVMFKQDVDADASADDLKRAHGLNVKAKWSAVKGMHVTLPAQASDQARQRLLERISSDPRVELVEADAVVTASQIGLTSPRVPGGINFLYNYAATTVTENLNSGSTVRIAVIDTGIFAHPDLKLARTSAGAVIGINFVSGLSSSSWSDANGHGTHCAGSAAAILNTIGVVGIAPNVELVPVRVLDASGSGSTAGVISGVNWVKTNAAAFNIKVASMSLGGGAYSTLDNAINALDAAGVVVVVAAGNSGADLMNYSPARAAGAITITAINNNDDSSNPTWSNFGTGKAHVYAAPGVNILSTWIKPKRSSCNPCYNTISGTSMATPHVAGLVAACFARGQCTDSATAKAYLQNCAAGGVNAKYRFTTVSGVVRPLGPEVRYKTC